MFRMEKVLLVTPETEEEEIKFYNKFSMCRYSGIIRKTFIVPKDRIQAAREFIEEIEKGE